MTEPAIQPARANAAAEIIREAVDRLVETAQPVTVILFGSFARGDYSDESDLDFLVILPTVTDHYGEMVRLRRVLARIPMPIDVLVYSVEEVRRRGNLRGTVLYHALQEGKVLYATA